ncbi:FAD-binding oxidoreductase [Breoghania sp. JC706]|uniref:NAD(P)/FAD-dependent oxidoreductase n=1 Tax=Breoghania sp. JC706 TaxID=3117732 RepID=UPI0030094597
MSETADILVIGGGIAGIGAAARLSPHTRVIVLEMEDALGRHATGRSAAIYIRNYGNATLRALNVASEPVLKEPDGIAEETLLTPRGEMLIASEDEIDAFEAYLKGADGMETLTPEEAVDLFPLLRREKIAAAAIERDAQDIDVDRLLQGFARLARRNGARLVTDALVQTATRTGGVWRVETPKGTFEAPVIVNAAGAWADVLAETAGIARVGLVPMRRSAAIVPPPSGIDVTRWPLVASASETWYAKPDAGKLMVSPADEDPAEPHDAWPDDMVLAEGLHRFEQAVTMPVTRVERSWAGLRSFVSDRTPVVGFAPDADGFFWLAGQGGYGVQTAPALSQLAADLCLGHTPKLPADIVAALDPTRLS